MTTPTTFPREVSSSTQNCVGYYVEARCTLPEPHSVNGMLLDERWKRVHFDPAPPGCGVPTGDLWDWPLRISNLYSFESAQALRWWFHANAGFRGGLGLETRLVRCKITATHTATAISVCDVVKETCRG